MATKAAGKTAKGGKGNMPFGKGGGKGTTKKVGPKGSMANRATTAKGVAAKKTAGAKRSSGKAAPGRTAKGRSGAGSAQ